MLSFSRPAVDLAADRRLNARWIGSTDAVRARRRYRLDHTSAVVGKGQNDFDRARSAVSAFVMGRQGWVDVELEHPTAERGRKVAIISQIGPVWSASIGVITRVEDGPRRYAFSYGTTDAHVAKGEEQFEVVLHDNDDVVFSITAVSRPARWWAWLGYPITRWAQRRFRRGAVKAIKAIVSN